MPLYEYQCGKCQNRLEAIQRFSEEPYTICPQCGGNLKKLISSPAIKFKGSGFYITDYGKSGSSSAGGSSESSGTTSPAGSATAGTTSSSATSTTTSTSGSSSGSGDSK